MARTKKVAATPYAALQENVANAGRNLWLAGLGALAAVGEESTSLFDNLVEKGRERKPKVELPKLPQVGQLVEDAGERVKEFGSKAQKAVNERTAAALHRFGMPSRDEIQQLIRRVEQLSTKVEALANQRAIVN